MQPSTEMIKEQLGIKFSGIVQVNTTFFNLEEIHHFFVFFTKVSYVKKTTFKQKSINIRYPLVGRYLFIRKNI